MPLAEFWDNVRARNPLFQEGVSPPDVQFVTADELDAALRSHHEAWRPHGLLKGYDEKDYDFLASAERNRLTELVTEFNTIAPELRSLWHGVPPQEVRLVEVTDRARPLLRDIILLLEQHRYRSPDALRFGKLVERELGDTLPDGVVELRFQVGNDWTGDRSLWVWVMLPLNIDTDDGERDFVQALGDLRSPISDACRKAVPDLFAYVSFRATETPETADSDSEGVPAGSAA